MNMLQLIGIGITGVIAATVLKNYRPELAVGVVLITVAIIFSNVIILLDNLFFSIERLIEAGGIDKKYFGLIMKIIGISYLCEIACSLCRDAGQATIAVKLELAGKLFVLMYSLPLISGFLEVCINAVSLI